MSSQGILESEIEKGFYALGTLNYLKMQGGSDELAELAMQKALDIDNRMSAFKPDSEISALARYAGRRFIRMSDDTFMLLRRSKEFGWLSDGAFDITIRPLTKLWGIGKKGDYVPDDTEIKKAKILVDYNDLFLDKDEMSACLNFSGQSVDLGGIAKGYAADMIKELLTEHKVEHALINLGGNINLVGCRPDGSDYRIGIQNPLEPNGSYIGILSISDCSIVTSGSNERFFVKDGVRYHHIIDPRSGRPAQSRLLSVTVVSSSSIEADALSTALFILGEQEGTKLLNKFDAGAIFISEDLTVSVTDNLINRFELTVPKG